MKRAPLFVVAGAIVGFAGVLGFQSRPAVSLAAGPAGAAAGRGKGASPPAGPSASPSASSAAPATSTGPAASATGTMVQYGYGELTVKVTVSGSHITSISVPTLRTAEPYSQQLAQQVIPMLKNEVLQVQSARINGVSGATYTSDAYAQSLQSALDKLHVK